MQKFKFSLAEVKRYREIVEVSEKEKLARAQEAETRERQKLEAYQEALAKEEDLLPSGELEVGTCQYLAAYRDTLALKITQQKSNLKEMEEKVAFFQNRVLEAQRQRKVFEKLEAKQKEEYLYAAGREEQNESDDLALTRFNHDPRRRNL